MFALEITLLLVYIVYRQLRGDPFPILSNSRCASRFLEILFVFVAILIPSTHHWVPFLHGKFGLAGAYCWIRETDDDCKDLGITEQLAFYGIAEAIGLTSVVAVVGLSVVYCRIAYKYKLARRNQLTLIRQTLILMCFLVTHVVFLSAGLVARFLPGMSKTEHLVFWFFNAAGIPVSLLVIPIGFVIHVYSTRMECLRYCKELCCCNSWKRKRLAKLLETAEDMSSNRKPHPIHSPSMNHWTTDGYTAISVNDGTERIDSVSAYCTANTM